MIGLRIVLIIKCAILCSEVSKKHLLARFKRLISHRTYKRHPSCGSAPRGIGQKTEGVFCGFAMSASSFISAQDRLIRLPETLVMLGVSRATLYRNIKRGHYPTPVQIGERAIGWRLSQIVNIVENGINPAAREARGVDGLPEGHKPSKAEPAPIKKTGISSLFKQFTA